MRVPATKSGSVGGLGSVAWRLTDIHLRLLSLEFGIANDESGIVRLVSGVCAVLSECDYEDDVDMRLFVLCSAFSAPNGAIKSTCPDHWYMGAMNSLAWRNPHSALFGMLTLI